MRFDPEQHMVIIKPASSWAGQVEEACAAIEAANGGVLPAQLAECHAVDPVAFRSLIEALYALYDGRVSEDLVRLAGLVPVDQALGG
jgi:hypothetical protein